MRGRARRGLALAALALLLGAVLGPRLLGSEAVRRRVEAEAGERLGVELRCRQLGLGLLPPSLRLVQLRVAGLEAGSPPLLEAGRAELRVAALPLLAQGRILAQLELGDARLRLDDLELRGPVRVALELSGQASGVTGRFELEATGAEVRYAGAFSKPEGTPARLSGRIIRHPDGALGVDDVRLQIRSPQGMAPVRQVPE